MFQSIHFFLFRCLPVLFFVGMPQMVFAQSTTEGGQEIAVPWVLGNAMFLAFAGLTYYLAIRTNKRSESALEAKKKKKKLKTEPDYSKGPIYHPDLSNNIGLTLVGWFTGLPLIFTFPKSKKINDEVKNDPRLKGEGMAQFGVVLNYIGIVLAPILYLTVLGVGIWVVVQALSS